MGALSAASQCPCCQHSISCTSCFRWPGLGWVSPHASKPSLRARHGVEPLAHGAGALLPLKGQCWVLPCNAAPDSFTWPRATPGRVPGIFLAQCSHRCFSEFQVKWHRSTSSAIICTFPFCLRLQRGLILKGLNNSFGPWIQQQMMILPSLLYLWQ